MTNPRSGVPAVDRHFEDYVPGMIETLGPIAMSDTAIIEFAQRYDPQAIHTDPVFANAGPFGGLIASGWHTVCVVMRELVLGYLAGSASLASPGVDELRWQKPVRPGDSLHVRVTVVEANDRGRSPTAASSHVDRGDQSARRGRDEHDGDESDSLPRRFRAMTVGLAYQQLSGPGVEGQSGCFIPSSLPFWNCPS
jgi:acyl dehydratase